MAIYLHWNWKSIEAQKFPPKSSNYCPDDSIDNSHYESHFEYIGKVYITSCWVEQKKKKKKLDTMQQQILKGVKS